MRAQFARGTGPGGCSLIDNTRNSNHGSRNSTLDVGCSSADNSFAGDVFAQLIGESNGNNVGIAAGTRRRGCAAAVRKSAASWPAIIAGAAVAASVSLVLLVLGSGLGFASISPWAGLGMSAKTFAVTTAIWLIVMQWLSSGVGGYIRGQAALPLDRHACPRGILQGHGAWIITWAVATILVAAILAAPALSTVMGGARAAGGVVSGVAVARAVGSRPRRTGMSWIRYFDRQPPRAARLIHAVK